MKSCQFIQEIMSDSLFESLTADQQLKLDHHLETCDTCQKEYHELKAVLRTMDQRKSPQPDPAFMTHFWNRLSPKLDKSASAKPLWKIFNDLIKPKWAVPLTAVCCIIIGIWIGRGTTPVANQVFSHSQKTEKGGHRVSIDSRANRIFKSSQRVLLAFLNFDSLNDDPDILNLSAQKQLAEHLVVETDRIRTDLSEHPDPRLEELITDLEMILIQIANLEATNNLESVEMIRDGVENRGILFKIQIRELNNPEENSISSSSQI